MLSKEVWVAPFEAHDERPDLASFPRWLCPTCDQGHLRPHPGTFEDWEDAGSRDTPHDDWFDRRFRFRLCCESEACGEICDVAGTAQVHVEMHVGGRPGGEPVAVREVRWSLYPRSVWPAPSILRWRDVSGELYADVAVPKRVTVTKTKAHVDESAGDHLVARRAVQRAVEPELDRAALLYWVDPDAAAAALRTGCERLFDILHVPKFRSNGKPHSFGWRTRWLAAAFPDAHEAIDALLALGHQGAHESGLAHSAAFDAFRILEHGLLAVFGPPNDLPGLIARIRAERRHPGAEEA